MNQPQVRAISALAALATVGVSTGERPPSHRDPSTPETQNALALADRKRARRRIRNLRRGKA